MEKEFRAIPVIHLGLTNKPLLYRLGKFANKRGSNETVCSKKTLVSSNVPTLESPKIRGPNPPDENNSRCKPVLSTHYKTESCFNQKSIKSSRILTILQRSYLMYNIIQGKNHKLFQILKEPIKSCSICFECELTNKIMQKNIRVRYVTTPDQYNAKVIDDAVNNENTHFVSTFKDFVIYDNIEEFFKRFYNNDESTVRIPKIYNRFYKDSEFIPQCQVFSAEEIGRAHV